MEKDRDKEIQVVVEEPKKDVKVPALVVDDDGRAHQVAIPSDLFSEGKIEELFEDDPNDPRPYWDK